MTWPAFRLPAIALLLLVASGAKFNSENVVKDDQGRWRIEKLSSDGEARGQLETEILANPGEIEVGWLAQWTAPLRWTKSAKNPIYGPAQSGDWDAWTNGVSIVPTADGRKYRMYYADRKNGIGFAEASIDDPLTWTEHPASPVLKPLADTWEGERINQPRVVAVTPDHWRMYYTGWGFDGPGTKWAMGLAESHDGGVTWKRVSDKPILDRGDASSPDGGGACVPMVLKVGDRWMMWYTAGEVAEEGALHVHLCLATSDDGVHWTKYENNPVLGDDFSDGAKRNVTSRCYVRHDDGVFRMWYSYAKPDYRIYYAESLDGIHWERAPGGQPVLDVSPSGWDSKIVEYPEVQIVDGVYRLWYCGNGFGSVGYAEGEPDTGIDVSYRTGDTDTPDDTWTAWTPVANQQRIKPRSKVQFRVELWSRLPDISPTLSDLDLGLVEP